MNKYEQLAIKLKMVELVQNQALLDITADLVGTPEARGIAIEASDVLTAVKNEVTDSLKR